MHISSQHFLQVCFVGTQLLKRYVDVALFTQPDTMFITLCTHIIHRAAAAPSEGDAAHTSDTANTPTAIPPEWESWALEQLERDRQQGMAEYEALKQTILRRLQRTSALLALYLLVVASGEVCVSLILWEIERVCCDCDREHTRRMECRGCIFSDNFCVSMKSPSHPPIHMCD